jgi:hypothetical protein
VLSYIDACGLLAVLNPSLFHQKAICLGATLRERSFWLFCGGVGVSDPSDGVGKKRSARWSYRSGRIEETEFAMKFWQLLMLLQRECTIEVWEVDILG